AVGYRADVNVIPDLSHMTPTVVIADGKIVARNGALTVGLASPAWRETFEPAALPRLPAGAFTARENTPGMRLVNDVITEPVPVFSLLFLTFDSLPWIRLTSRGVWDVRNRRVLTPSTPL